jgi:WD40 repeat protein
MTRVNVKKLHTLTGHSDCVYALQQGSEPNLFFSGAGDGQVVLWDLRKPEAGQLIARLPNSIYALHYLKDSDLLVVGHNYEGVHLLDWRAKKEIGSLKITASFIFDACSLGQDLFVASGDGVVTVVDLTTWAIRRQVKLSEKSARVLAVNPVQGELAVGYSDNSIRVLNLDDLKVKYEWYGHRNSVFTLVYSPDFKTLLSGSRDAHLKAWDAQNGYRQAGGVVAHLYAINHIAYSPDAKHFVTCSLDKSIKVWKADDLTLLKVIDKSRHAGHGTSVNKLLWTPFDHVLLSASDDRTISVWDIIFNQD